LAPIPANVRFRSLGEIKNAINAVGMCGIAGIWSRGGLPADLRTDRPLSAMAESLAHRGPDGQGTWRDDRVGLAHTRLAILDLSDAAAQPMHHPDGTLHLVFNGEIYNFRALRHELEAQGIRFRSSGDTEVLLHALKVWGADAIPKLHGMFAFAVWDSARKELLLARDRVGEKPLYFSRTHDRFLFGSEIRAILNWPDQPRRPDLRAIHDYLTFQYVPAPATAFSDIQILPPGHFMRLTRDGNVDLRRYWAPPKPNKDRRRSRDSRIWERLDSAIVRSIQQCQTADVPVGLFLSGGLDSGTIAATISQNGDARVTAFTVGFDEKSHDESESAASVAESLGLAHRIIRVTPEVEDLPARLAKIFNQPFADPSAIATFVLARTVRQETKVALTGDGGDEAFLGYQRYLGMRLGEDLDRLPRFLRHAMGAIARSLPMHLVRAWSPIRYAHRLASVADALPLDRYASWISYLTDDAKAEIYGPKLRSYLPFRSVDKIAPLLAGDAPAEAQAAYTDLQTYLPGALLNKIDTTSMACGLEVRAPFLDHEILDIAAPRIRFFKIHGLATKWPLRKRMRGRLPPDTLRKRKWGFGVPLDSWLRNELRDQVSDTLLSRRAHERGLIDHKAVDNLLSQHMTGRRDHQYRIWALYMMELWYREWIDPIAVSRP